jgi:hypothetical protein
VGVSFSRPQSRQGGTSLIPWNGSSALKFFPGQPARGGQAPEDGLRSNGRLLWLYQTRDSSDNIFGPPC